MVDNSVIDSASVSLLAAYNATNNQLSVVQSAVSTGYDVSKPSDNPLVFFQSQSLRRQANSYSTYITKLTQSKSAIDQMQGSIKTVTDLANKISDQITGMANNPSGQETLAVASNIKTYLRTIQSVLSTTVSRTGMSLSSGTVGINFQTGGDGAVPMTLTFKSDFLNISQILRDTTTSLPAGNNASGYIQFANGATYMTADLSTASHRASFLANVNSWIVNNLSNAAANAGAFSNALDAQLATLQTNQSTLNAQADALTKTDLTADSAKTAALSTQQQLLTNLMSLSNQRMQTVLALFR